MIPVLFVLSICIILTMYGGGFSTVPAYLADIFGTQMVGAIHGRLHHRLVGGGRARAGARSPASGSTSSTTAWRTAVSIDRTLYIMAGLLFVGLICKLLMRPVAERHHMRTEEAKA